MDSQAFVLPDEPAYKDTIYIRTDTKDGFYQRSQGGTDASDYTFYGASALRHEKVHLDGDASEHDAFSVQQDVWQRMQHYIQNQVLWKGLNDALKKGIKDNP